MTGCRTLLRTHKVRADTTLVGTNVAYPTDLGLLTLAVDKLVATAKRVQAAGVPPAAGSGTPTGGSPWAHEVAWACGPGGQPGVLGG